MTKKNSSIKELIVPSKYRTSHEVRFFAWTAMLCGYPTFYLSSKYNFIRDLRNLTTICIKPQDISWLILIRKVSEFLIGIWYLPVMLFHSVTLSYKLKMTNSFSIILGGFNLVWTLEKNIRDKNLGRKQKFSTNTAIWLAKLWRIFSFPLDKICLSNFSPKFRRNEIELTAGFHLILFFLEKNRKRQKSKEKNLCFLEKLLSFQKKFSLHEFLSLFFFVCF